MSDEISVGDWIKQRQRRERWALVAIGFAAGYWFAYVVLKFFA